MSDLEEVYWPWYFWLFTGLIKQQSEKWWVHTHIDPCTHSTYWISSIVYAQHISSIVYAQHSTGHLCRLLLLCDSVLSVYCLVEYGRTRKLLIQVRKNSFSVFAGWADIDVLLKSYTLHLLSNFTIRDRKINVNCCWSRIKKYKT